MDVKDLKRLANSTSDVIALLSLSIDKDNGCTKNPLKILQTEITIRRLNEVFDSIVKAITIKETEGS